MFPGSLQLGKWRLRGTDSGQAVLEWFAEEFGAWRQVTAFTQDANAVGLETGRLRADTLLIGPDELGIGAGAGLAAWVNGKLRATDNLETAARLRTGTVEPFADAAVQVASNLAVDGSLTVGENLQTGTISAVEPITVVSTPAMGTDPPSHLVAGTLVLGRWRIRGNQDWGFALERLDDDGAERTDYWYPVCNWGFNTEINSPSMGVDNLGVAYNFSAGNMTVTGTSTLQDVSAASLTVNGLDIVQGISNSEPAFTAVAPLHKVVNFQTGALELRVDTTGLGGNSPYWIAGRVDGASVTVECTVPGTQPCSIARSVGKPTGIFDITFPAHPNGANYVVMLTSYQNGPVRVWEIVPLTSTSFTFNMTGWTGAPQNGKAFVAV
jgi:hypothetical protein